MREMCIQERGRSCSNTMFDLGLILLSHMNKKLLVPSKVLILCVSRNKRGHVLILCSNSLMNRMNKLCVKALFVVDFITSNRIAWIQSGCLYGRNPIFLPLYIICSLMQMILYLSFVKRNLLIILY